MTDFNIYDKEIVWDIVGSTIGGAFTGFISSLGLNVLIAAPLLGVANTGVGII